VKFVTVRELRLRSRDIWQQLDKERHMVITSNGRPVAVLSSVNQQNLDDFLATLRRGQALAAVTKLQEESVARGLDKLTEDEIEAEIQAVRQSRMPGSRG